MPKAEFGVRLPIAGPFACIEAIAKVARNAEGLGYDALWAHDFIIWTKRLHRVHMSCGAVEALREDQNPDFYEPLTTLSYVASMTSKIRLGTSVLILPIRDAILAARQVCNLDVISGGRLILGIGMGAPLYVGNRDFEVLRIPRNEKKDRTEESIRVMKELWARPVAAFSGKYYKFTEAELFPKPIQKPHPPIWMAGASPFALRIAAQHCDGWLPSGLYPHEYEEKLAVIKEKAREYNRPTTPGHVGNEIFATVSDSAEGAKRISYKTLVNNATAYAATRYSSAVTAGDPIKRSMETNLIGSPSEIIRIASSFADAGVNHFEMRFIYQSMENLIEQMNMFAEEVIPSFR